MNTQLLCTFTAQNNLQQTVDVIVDTYDVLYNKIFILCNVEDNRELMCTYNIQKTQNFEILNNTISLHRKKQTNTLYTINALNRLIESLNNGVLDTSYKIIWENYRNCLLTTNELGLKQINTNIHEIVRIKIKD
tara:strand:- start:12988 stop:13389 length:402 start_codon:yes stop_codon:yes gene_type:complete